MQLAVLSAPGSIMPMMLLSGFFVNQRDMTWVFRWYRRGVRDVASMAWGEMTV